MALERVFGGAGKTPGLQVWRVEDKDLKPVPKELHGNFFTGDCYIVLFTADGPSHSAHAWIGAEACQMERGAVSVFLVQLDDFLGGAATQFMDFQNQESVDFLGYFKRGLKYQKGGVASGFQHVVTNQVDVKRLLHVKGRRRVRANEVPLSWESFNKSDCFLIDLGKIIYHWSGSKANHFERLKSTELAIDIRDNERSGRCDISLIAEGSEPEEVIELLGPLPDLPLSSVDDKAADKINKNKASLFRISNASGSMDTTLVAESNPFQQDMLTQEDCYILDNGEDGKVFVWKGRTANPEERKAGLKAAEKFISDKGYSKNTQVQIMAAGAETMLFKQFFFNWLDKDETTGPTKGYAVGRIAKVEKTPFDASKLHTNKAMVAQHGMVDDGSGKFKIWRVENGDKVPVDVSTYGQFYGGDCYLILYSYIQGGKEKHIIYTWQGRKSSVDEIGASAYLTVKLDDSMGGVATQVRVTHGKEPAHLVSLFKDKPLVIHLGGTSREGGQTESGSTRLYHVRRSSTNALRAVEVEPKASSLNTNDVFVLKTPNALFQWKGMGATGVEVLAAGHVASLLGGSPTDIKESKEPSAFWTALGGKASYQTSKTLRSTLRSPRLFCCSNKTGRLIAEEVPGEFCQLDLATDDVMILDTWDQLFVWIGENANEIEKEGSLNIANDYLMWDPSGRVGIPVSVIKQGKEPLSFIGWFHGWDAEMWKADPIEILQTRINASQ